jgi:hypothetical protein
LLRVFKRYWGFLIVIGGWTRHACGMDDQQNAQMAADDDNGDEYIVAEIVYQLKRYGLSDPRQIAGQVSPLDWYVADEVAKVTGAFGLSGQTAFGPHLQLP